MNSILDFLAKFFGHTPMEGVEALLFRIFQTVLVLLVTFVLSRWLHKGIRRYFKKANQQSDASVATYQKICRAAVWTFGFLVALHALGMDMSQTFTTSGLFAVAISFEFKDVGANYAAGLILKANDSIKHGDILDVDGRMLRVKSIAHRDTTVRTKDGLDIIIPNTLLTQ